MKGMDYNGVGWCRGEDTCKMLFGDRISRMDWMQKVEGWEESRVKPGFWLQQLSTCRCQLLNFIWWVDREQVKSRVPFRSEFEVPSRDPRDVK